MNPPSTAAKAYIGALAAVCGTIAGTFASTALGKVCAVLAAGLLAYLGVFKTRNTETAETGPGVDPAVRKVVTATGEAIGTTVTDTGAAAGGLIAGTTGVVGQVLNATVGKVLPGGTGRHG